MPHTPRPDVPHELERPRLAAALQHARSALVVRPPASAFDVAQGVLLPLLSSLGVDVFDLERLRMAEGAGSTRVEFLLQGEPRLRFVIMPVQASLPPADDAAVVVTNGKRWRLGDAGEFDLNDEELANRLGRLLAGEEPDLSTAVTNRDSGAGHDTGEKSPPRQARPPEFAPAGPLERITLEEIRGYAGAVRNMRGKLQVWFEGEPVDITSRSAFYYVLAELALRHGREDAIPGDDLVVPPDEAPAHRRARPLARPGWQLLVDHEPDVVEERTLELIEALGLQRQFNATQRGQPYPGRPE